MILSHLELLSLSYDVENAPISYEAMTTIHCYKALSTPYKVCHVVWEVPMPE